MNANYIPDKKHFLSKERTCAKKENKKKSSFGKAFLSKKRFVLKEKREDEMRGEYALCGFDQTFFKSLMHGSSPCGAMSKGRKETPKKSAEEGRYDINTRFFAECKKGTLGTFL